MIKNTIIPQKIGDYYLIPTVIVGVEIGRTYVNATKVYIRGRSIEIYDSVKEALAPGTSADYSERAVRALKNVLDRLSPYDEIVSVFSSSSVIFKELKFPFLDRNKIELTVAFEVEPLLPFALDDAVIDFIITKQMAQEGTSDVLVAAVQKQYLAQHLALFSQAQVDPTVVTVDLFAVYAMVLRMADRPHVEHSVLLDIGPTTTHIAYMHHDQLRLIRSLPSGLIEQTKKISDRAGGTHSQVVEYIMRFGVTHGDNEKYTQAIRAVFGNFIDTIAFTLKSIGLQFDGSPQDIHILLFGEGAQIKGFLEFMHETIPVPSALLNVSMLTSVPGITFAHKNSFDATAVTSLAAALPLSLTAHFNLRKKEFVRPSDRKLLERQLLTMGVLTSVLVISVFIHTTLQIKKVSNALEASRQEVMAVVQKHFGITSDGQDLEEVIQAAQRSVQEEEKLWFSLANPARLSFLHYLLELTNRIDKEGLGFAITSLRIANDTITLQARVRDYTALTFIEKELRQSPLFSYVEGQDNPEFTMKIRLAKNPRRTG